MPLKYKGIVLVQKCCSWLVLIGFAYVFPALIASSVLAVQAEAGEETLNKIPFQYKRYAVVPGQRFCRQGKERIAAKGTITYFDGDRESSEPVQIIRQTHSKIRINQGGKVTVFDRNNPKHTIPSVQKTADTIQVLLEDSAEGFLDLLQSSIAVRHLGTGFRLENATASNPGMDVILMSYPDVFRNNTSIQKAFWFDSRTKLLGVVSYVSRSGSVIHVVVDDYRDVDGEKLPFRIERWEDSRLSMRLSLNEANLSAGAEDGTFGGN